ncbi:aldo/keto reductase [Micromonospora echinospora]
MKYRPIGRTSLKASVVTFGAMGIGGGFRYPDADDAVSVRAVRAALDRGVNVIDTAPVYGFGHSEEVIGEAVRGRRDEVVIATKCGLWWGDDEGSYRFTWDGHAVKRNLSPRTIRIEVEESLRRLGTDRIDIYYTHNPAMPPFVTPIEDTIATLLALRDEGKILTIGASNCPPEDVETYLAHDAIEIVQRRYNLLAREVRDDILPLCVSTGLSLHAYSPLANGLLTGAFTRSAPPAREGSRRDDPLFGDRFGPAMDLVEGLTAVASSLGTTPGALAIAHLLASSDAVNVICGIRREAHLDDVVAGTELVVDASVTAALDELAQGFEATAPVPA